MFNLFECCLCQNHSCSSDEWICKICSSQFFQSIESRGQRFVSNLSFPVFSALRHTPTISKFIRVLKTQPEFLTGVEPYDWVQRLCHHWSAEVRNLNVDCVIALPSNSLRIVFQRPLSFQIGLEWSKILGLQAPELEALEIPLLRNLNLKGSPQKFLTRRERLASKSGEFFSLASKTKNKLKDRKVLIVDDVMTTGSSLNNAAELLKNHGAKVLGAFVLSRVEALNKTH